MATSWKEKPNDRAIVVRDDPIVKQCGGLLACQPFATIARALTNGFD
jgi:hypothetical protein